MLPPTATKPRPVQSDRGPITHPPDPPATSSILDNQKERSAAYLRGLGLLVSAASSGGWDGSVIGLLLARSSTASVIGLLEARSNTASNSASQLWSAPRLSALAGTLAALWLGRGSDRVGRRPVPVWSVAGYTCSRC